MTIRIEMSEINTVVTQFGSFHTRIGTQGDPRGFNRPVIGIPKDKSYEIIGYQALHNQQSNDLDLFYPISKGYITDFEKFEKILNYTFYKETLLTPQENIQIIVDAVGNSSENRVKLGQLIFEEYEVPALAFLDDATSSLYGSGRLNGVVVNIGHETCNVSCCYDEQVLPNSLVFGQVAGKTIDDHIIEVFKKQNIDTSNMESRDSLTLFKSHFLEDFDKSLSNEFEFYEVIDGSKIKKDKIIGLESLFKPELFNIKDDSIVEKVIKSVKNSYSFLENDLIDNIVLSGGTTLLKGFDTRLQEGLSRNFTKSVQIIANDNRKNLAWHGAFIPSEMSTYGEFIMNIDEFREFGPQKIRHKYPSTDFPFKNTFKIIYSNYIKILKSSSKNGDISFKYYLE